MNLRRKLGSTNAAMWRDDVADGRRTGVVMVSGLNGASSHLYSRPAGTTDQLDLALPTLEAGFPTAQGPSGAGWGNTSSVSMVNTLITEGISTYGFADGPVHYYGQSHGAIIGLKCLMDATVQQRIQSMVLAICPNDIQALYNENRSGLASSISSAYGGAPSDAVNPADNTIAIKATGVPILYIYSGNDPLVTVAEHTAFINAVECETVYMGSAGHTLAFNYDHIPEWFERHDERWHG